MKHRLPAAFAALCLLPIAGAFAQGPAGNSRKPAAVATKEGDLTLVAVDEPRFDIEVNSGMPAEEAVNLLGMKLKKPINVVFTGDSASAPLPGIRLHQVTLAEFFLTLEAAAQAEQNNGNQGCVFTPVPGAEHIYTFRILPAIKRTEANGADPFAQVVIQDGSEGGGGITVPSNQKSSLFFDLSAIVTDKLKVEDITTAIRTAWMAMTGPDEFQKLPQEALRFHQETKLLIATGTPELLQSVSQIVEILRNRNMPSKDDQQREMESVRRRADMVMREAEENTMRLSKSVDEREKQIQDLRNRIAELEIELAKKKS